MVINPLLTGMILQVVFQNDPNTWHWETFGPPQKAIKNGLRCSHRSSQGIWKE